jgi:hypothetical protein
MLRVLLRWASSKSDRNRSTTFIGTHKEPLSEEQAQRRRDRRRAFVLGRDNVKRVFEPIHVDVEALERIKSQLQQNPRYQVKRTTNGFLPVYTEYKNGRGQISTVIRRVDGDINVILLVMILINSG